MSCSSGQGMSSIKKVDFGLKDEVSSLLTALKRDFPLSKSMYQVVKDTRDGLMEANVFTDVWPDYTTVVSQEMVPRLSESADIRVFTKNREKVLDVLNAARLLDDIAERQFIFIMTDEGDERGIVSYLRDALQRHPAVIQNSLSVRVESLPVECADESYGPVSSNPLPPGYEVHDLLPEHMRRVAENWNLKNWFTEFVPLETKMEYVTELAARYTAIGVFRVDHPTQPVSWGFRKSGGLIGIAFTMKEERSKFLSLTLATILCSRIQNRANGDVILTETTFTPFERIGEMHVLMLLKDTNSSPNSKL